MAIVASPGGLRSTFKQNWLWLLFFPLLLLNGLTVLLRSASYPLLSEEVALAGAVLAISGMMVGFVLIWVNKYVQRFVVSVFITLLLILIARPFPELSWFPPGTLPAALTIFMLSFLLLSLIWKHWPTYLITISLFTLVSAFFTVASGLKWQSVSNPGKTGNEDLAPYIHIVLDEHIGTEGILADYDEKTQLSGLLTEDYTSLGFTVFGRAFSRYKTTRNSFGSFLNFSSDILETINGYRYLQKNKLFEVLQTRGYSLNVIHPGLHDLCHSPDRAFTVTSCFSFPFSPTLEGLKNSDLSVSDKAIVILNTLIVRTALPSTVDGIAESGVGKRLSLPGWPLRTCISCIASKTAMAKFEKEIETIRAGDAYFVHLLLPHGPYDNYLDNCSVTYAPVFTSGKFSDRYARYLTQLRCTHKRVIAAIDRLLSKELMKNATIIVQSDHGTRVYKSKVEAYGPNTEKGIQAYSTFFAVRRPGFGGGVDRTPLPLDVLLHRTLKPDTPAPGEPYLVTYPEGKMSMPPFSYGAAASDW